MHSCKSEKNEEKIGRGVSGEMYVVMSKKDKVCLEIFMPNKSIDGYLLFIVKKFIKEVVKKLLTAIKTPPPFLSMRSFRNHEKDEESKY